jgi:chemotaxis protein methyltransferase WspC
MMLKPEVALSIYRATGLDLAPATVERAIRQRMKECAITRSDVYFDRLNQDTEEFSALTELVVVPETWFFRDHAAFGTAVQFVRNRLGQGKGPVSILSVPCATGEEPYSLAMALLDAGIAASEFSIEAIDISKRAIQFASNGAFGRNAFRTQDLSFRDRHFAHSEHAYVLSRRVRDCVTFSQGNLLAPDMAARADSYDVIFCRNLLIYFNDRTQQEAASRIAAMLRSDGLLFAGYAEVPVFHHHGFESTPDPKAFCLSKTPVGKASVPAGADIRRPSIRAVTLNQALPRRVDMANSPPPKTPRPRLPAVSEVKNTRAEVLLAEARNFADRGEFKSAGIRLTECLRHRPDFAEANLLFGLISERNGDLRAAEDYIRRAVYFDPQHYEAVCHLAILAEKQGNAVGANAARQRAARVLQRQEGKKSREQ